MPMIRFPKWTRQLALLISLMCFQWIGAHAEALSYTVFKGGDKIGKININRKTNNNITEYFFESNVKLRFIISIEVYDKMKVTFQGAQMLEARLYRTLNGKVKVDNLAAWNGSYYEMKNKDNEKSFYQYAGSRWIFLLFRFITIFIFSNVVYRAYCLFF